MSTEPTGLPAGTQVWWIGPNAETAGMGSGYREGVVTDRYRSGGRTRYAVRWLGGPTRSGYDINELSTLNPLERRGVPEIDILREDHP